MEYIYEIQPSFDKPHFHHTDFSSTHLHLDRCVHFLKLKIFDKILISVYITNDIDHFRNIYSKRRTYLESQPNKYSHMPQQYFYRQHLHHIGVDWLNIRQHRYM